ncbi:MAG: T9SS type A sorting domain-containing protein, partial [candidate division Zixibacteria bacterium]|nr:T9SS type A sorting domain-containing protein [candidate division Zixibacteria bacterium]
WNQVANPFPFDIAWADIKFDDNGNIVDSDNATVVYPEPFAYNGGFAAATVIYGWDGVFIYAEKAGVNMLWPYREAGTLVAAPSKETPPIAASATSWQIELSLEANDGIDRSNFAGVHTGALDGPDCYDQYDPPPPPDAPQLSFELSGNQPPLRCADFRAPYNDGAEWQVVIYKAEDRKLTINGLNNIPPDMEAWLILDIGQTINLDDNRTIALPNDVTSARLIIGTSEYASKEVSEALPDDYALYQNFPNPFNPTTTIRYALPADGHVRLEIINLLGQVVTMLVDEKRSAGVHTVDWDGRDGGNQSVASGIYFYRLVSGQYTANRKMVLLK